jgi:hypothetical protein
MNPASICVSACADVNSKGAINRKKRASIAHILSGLYSVLFVMIRLIVSVGSLFQRGCLAKGIDQVPQTEQRVPKQHSWARITHDLLYFMLPGPGVTVHLAVIAGRFAGLKRASIKSTSCVGQETITVFAYLVTGSMLVRTIDTDHRFDGAFLPLYSA